MINFVQEAFKLISMDSVSANGNEEIAVHAQQLMHQIGMKTILQPAAHSIEGVSKRQFNAIGILGDTLVDSRTKKGLLLCTHLDTCSPGLNKNWDESRGDPFRATVKDDKIIGLGAANAKLDFLCKLKACERYRDRKFKMPIYLVGSAGGELGGLGARFLVKSMTLNPMYVLTGEPTGLKILDSHKAYALYQVSVNYNLLERDAKGFNTRIEVQCYGKSSHGSYPELGENAIHRAIEVIRKIKEANFELRLSKIEGGDAADRVPDQATIEFYIQNSSFDDFKKFYRENLVSDSGNVQIEFGGLGETGVRFLPDNILDAVASIENYFLGLKGGILNRTDDQFDVDISSVNFCRVTQRAGSVDVWFDLKLLPDVAIDTFEKQLKEGIQQQNSQYPNIMMKASRVRYSPALVPTGNRTLSAAALEAQHGLAVDGSPKRQSTTTEAALFAASGFEAIAIGPGLSPGNSHSPNEFVSVDQLDRAVHFYDRLIERFCL